MKSILSTIFLVILSLSSALAAPGKTPKTDAKKPSPKAGVNATRAAFIPSAPRFVAYSDKFVSGVVPPASDVAGYNVFVLSFLLLRGPADQAASFAQLDAGTRANIIAQYHNAGIALMVSAFGSTEAPVSAGADPIATANTMAQFVKQNGLDGIDVDFEDFNAINSGTGAAESWLISFTNQLRSQLPAGQFIITHAPLGPWLTDNTNIYPKGAYHAVAQAVGNAVDWWNIQYYNQGNDYQDCNSLLTTSQSDFPHTSIFEINRFTGIPLSKLVLGKPASPIDTTTGFLDATTLAGCLAQGKNQGWSGGAMFWEYPEANAQWIRTVRSQSFPV